MLIYAVVIITLVLIGSFIIESDIKYAATYDEVIAQSTKCEITKREIVLQSKTEEVTTKATNPTEKSNKTDKEKAKSKNTETTENLVIENNEEDIESINYTKETNYTEPTQKIHITEYYIDLLARTIYQEAGNCSEYCQWLVGSTVMNLADIHGGIENVVFDYNKFNVAYKLYDATPSDLSYSVANRVLIGDRDYSVKAFRTDYYHSFGTPYVDVDNMYFSTY